MSIKGPEASLWGLSWCHVGYYIMVVPLPHFVQQIYFHAPFTHISYICSSFLSEQLNSSRVLKLTKLIIGGWVKCKTKLIALYRRYACVLQPAVVVVELIKSWWYPVLYKQGQGVKVQVTDPGVMSPLFPTIVIWFRIDRDIKANLISGSVKKAGSEICLVTFSDIFYCYEKYAWII